MVSYYQIATGNKIEEKLDAWEAKMLGYWAPCEGERVPGPMTREEWANHVPYIPNESQD